MATATTTTGTRTHGLPRPTDKKKHRTCDDQSYNEQLGGHKEKGGRRTKQEKERRRGGNSVIVFST
jgi:hypothetical protein